MRRSDIVFFVATNYSDTVPGTPKRKKKRIFLWERLPVTDRTFYRLVQDKRVCELGTVGKHGAAFGQHDSAFGPYLR